MGMPPMTRRGQHVADAVIEARDLVMELCCGLHNVRVRLTPWQPMI